MTGGSKTVLVVDDEPSIRLLCRINLELEGYGVLEAGSLAEAREHLVGGRVDAVLLDLHLGRDRSHELVAELAARTPRIPCALVTGSTDAASAAAAGADAVLPKPFALEELTRTVRALLDGR